MSYDKNLTVIGFGLWPNPNSVHPGVGREGGSRGGGTQLHYRQKGMNDVKLSVLQLKVV